MYIKLYRNAFILLLLLCSTTIAQTKRAMSLEDAMKFMQIDNSSISASGNWVGYTASPDRGNSEAVVKAVKGDKTYRFERGSRPGISRNEKWAVITLKPDFAETLKDKKKKHRDDLILLNLETGDTTMYSRVKSAEFSKNSEWLAIHHYVDTDSSGKEIKQDDHFGTKLTVKNLSSGNEKVLDFITLTASDSTSKYLAYVVSDTSNKNGIFLLDISSDEVKQVQVDTALYGYYSELTWHKSGRLAFTKSRMDKDGNPGNASLFVWNNRLNEISNSEDAGKGWFLPAQNDLSWSKDGTRLFFGYKPESEKPLTKEEKDTSETNIYDFEKILAETESDVWHWDDPLIKTNEKNEWKDIKKRTYKAVFNVSDGNIIRLADEKLPNVITNDNKDFALGISGIPYLKQRTWDGRYSDYYLVDLNTGGKTKIVERLESSAYLSPGGKYIVYYNEKEWFLYSTESKSTINLTGKLDVPFEDEDWDYPADVPGYGIAGWIENDESVLIYDKYDIWKFDTKTGEAGMITGGYGRDNNYIFRIERVDRDKEFYIEDEKILLEAYHDIEKYTGYYSTTAADGDVIPIIEEQKKYDFLRKAELTDKYLFTRESYGEFPDLWVSGAFFDNPKKVTNLGAQTEQFLWGNAGLIDFRNDDGVPLKGIVIYPPGYDPGKKYPVFVYYYRFFTQRLYDFPDITINHRPIYPVLGGKDYVVFMPDIVFEVGRPGLSATKCLVPGVKKLIDMGIAHPDKIALHGHSWSGYQTAMVVTHTDIFACAIAGAPVSNMTSAYSGIRWGSGLARQFQYEKTQSRIGKTLVEDPIRYIENSPVFYADRVNTPLLIQHGDEDEAVPWYQSIELYLALRRYEKDCVFLQYHGEPHHLKKFPNQLDYTIKMIEYIDHYCKGEPAADWISKGVIYKGK